MRATVASLMIVCLGLHAFVGCCWHHAHRCPSGCVGSGELDGSRPLAGGAHPDCDDHARPAREHRGPHHCEDRCVAVKPVDNGSVGSLGKLSLSPDIRVSADLACVAEAQAGWRAAACSYSSSMVRLHLAHQVLLI